MKNTMMNSFQFFRKKKNSANILVVKFFIVAFFVFLIFAITSLKKYFLPKTFDPSLLQTDPNTTPVRPGLAKLLRFSKFYSPNYFNTTAPKRRQVDPDDPVILDDINDECPVELVANFVPPERWGRWTECNFTVHEEKCVENEVLLVYYCVVKPLFYPYSWIGAVLFIFFGVILILLLFYIITDTTDEYFAPSIIKIVEYLKIPGPIAGVTILAFGNGAPDLFSILAGALTNNWNLAISAPVGGGVFTISVVFALVIIFTKSRVAPASFIRDVVFYILTTIFTYLFYSLRMAGIYTGVVLILVYIIYVIIVTVTYLIEKRVKKKTESKKEIDIAKEKQLKEGLLDGNEEDKDDYDSDEGLISKIKKDYKSNRLTKNDWTGGRGIRSLNPRKSVRNFNQNILKEYGEKKKERKSVVSNEDKRKSVAGKTYKTAKRLTLRVLSSLVNDEDLQQKIKEFEEADGSGETKPKGEEDEKKEIEYPKGCWGTWLKMIGWYEKTLVQKIVYVIFGWTRFFRNISIPKSENEQWNKWFQSCTPTFGMMILAFCMFKMAGITKPSLWWVILICVVIGGIIGIILSIIVFFTTKRASPPKYFFLLVFFGFLQCICWIYLCCETLMKIMTVFGKIMHINPSILGLTVLAWGNSFPDIAANILISLKGYPEMAAGACFGEPLLNGLFGMGLFFVYIGLENVIRNGIWCVPLFDDSGLVIFYPTLIIVSVVCLIFIPLMKYKIKKWFGLVLIALYVVSLIIVVLAEIFDGMGWFIEQYIQIPWYLLFGQSSSYDVCPLEL